LDSRVHLPPIAAPFLETMVRVVNEQCERQPD
jgi:hypothetical protein